ncbi:hypothetical protein ACXO21_00940 [Lactobacillus delbrueckii subsp. bulgaricus]
MAIIIFIWHKKRKKKTAKADKEKEQEYAGKTVRPDFPGQPV